MGWLARLEGIPPRHHRIPFGLRLAILHETDTVLHTVPDLSLDPSASTSASTNTSSSKKPKRTRPPIPNSSLLHPTISSLPNHNASNAHVLTPLRAHYLKKFLVNHQFMDELAVVSDPSIVGSDGIASLGHPFAPPKEQVPGGREGEMRNKPLPDLPFLKFMFRQFVLTFP
jgi:hypothetical protein